MKMDHTDITILLDRSGSMEAVRKSTISAVNEYVASQVNGPGTAVVSLIQFDQGSATADDPDFKEVYIAQPVASAPMLTLDTYLPRGMTPLLDAIGRAICRTGERLSAMAEPDRPGTVLFVIQTDGHENASREYTQHRVSAMIAEQRDKYRWQFVFLGAGIDAIASAAVLGIKARQAMSYGKSDGATFKTFLLNAKYTSDLRGARARGDVQADFEVDDADRSQVQE